MNTALEYYSRLTPEKVFIYYRDIALTYRDIYIQVLILSGYLKMIGIQKNDKICLLLPRTPELIIAFLAATKVGGVPAPVNFLMTPKNVKYFIKRNKPKAIISCDTIINAQLYSNINELQNIIRIDTGNNLNGWVPWKEVLSFPNKPINFDKEPHDIAYLNFTTGTSGTPKGAIATHENLYWNTRSIIELFQLHQNDIHLCMFASFAHPHELFARALYTGASIVLLQEINPKTIVKTVNRYEVTCIMGLAVMFEALATHCGKESIESLRIVESGGMYTREETNLHFLHSFGKPIYSVWGSTETSGVAIANSPQAYRADGSMGKACPYYEVKLMNNGKEVSSGEIGELHFRGPGVVKGYEGYSPLLDHDGWYATGDLAKKDERGFYYFIDRKSGMLKFAGLKIYPQQVENILLKYPGIIEAAVLGVTDKKKGEIPKAFIKVNGADIDTEEIICFCKKHLPLHMVPKGITILDNLPKIGSGKINKRAIVENLQS